MKIHPSILFGFVLAFCSCGGENFFEATVPIDVPPHEPRLAVTAHLAAGDSTLRIFVSHSVGILDNEDPQPVRNASVSIARNGQFLGFATLELNDLYLLHLDQPLPANPDSYSLLVAAPGYDSVSALQIMPTPIPIDSAWFEIDGAIDTDGEKVDELGVAFYDPAAEENFYAIEAWVVFDDKYTEKLQLESLDPLTEEGLDAWLLKDASFNGKRYEWRLKAYRFFNPDDNVKLFVRLRSISNDLYLYLRSVELADLAEGNPFAEPVIIHNNILGGYGIFSLESSEVKPVPIQ
ncbi:MAG: hypothetical protein KatS3mg029_0455 [Saprospiraceae bacterium]|nr:MAG: hypothetical protein KatS3mg029_0455 [Saprospiraceae bacterium]